MRLNGIRRIAIAICILGIWIAYPFNSSDVYFTFILAWIVDGFGN
jgi:hypothetical protein